MAKKILFFKSAEWSVIDLLITLFDSASEVYCFVQNDSADELKERYPDITGYILPHNYFCYDDFRSILVGGKQKLVFDEVYIPVTDSRLNGLEEIYDMLDDLTYHTVCLVNGEGEIVSSKAKEQETLWEIIYNHSTYLTIHAFHTIYNIKQKILSWRI